MFFANMRKFKSFDIKNIKKIKEKIFSFASVFDTLAYYDSCLFSQKNDLKHTYSKYEIIAGLGINLQYTCENTNPFSGLKNFSDKENDFLFGFLSYDLKNSIENLDSQNPDFTEFPKIFFFQPKYTIHLTENYLKIGFLNSSDEADELFKKIISQKRLIE